MASSALSFAVCGVAFVGMVLIIVGIATPAWTVLDESVDTSNGLWQTCVQDTCLDIVTKPPELEACEAFAILAVLSSAVCFGALLAFTVMGQLNKSPPNLLLNIARGTGIFAAICMIITTAIYGRELYDDTISGISLGYSFALTVVGGGLALLAAILSFFVKQN